MCARNTAAQTMIFIARSRREKATTRRKRKKNVNRKKSKQTREKIVNEKFFQINVLLHFKTAFNQQNKMCVKSNARDEKKNEKKKTTTRERERN